MMRMMNPLRMAVSTKRVSTLLPLLLSLTLPALAADYQSVRVDGKGQLHIVPGSGKEILPAKISGQVSFGDAAISPDGRTVGWLILYPDPTVTYYKGAELAGGLALYRAGRVVHVFRTDETFYDWQFRDGGKQVAYSTGPTHGGAAECVLREAGSGRIVATWPVRQESEPPGWAKGLRY